MPDEAAYARRRSWPGGTPDQRLDKLEQAIQRQFNYGSQQEKEQRALAEIVGNGGANFIARVAGEQRLDQAV